MAETGENKLNVRSRDFDEVMKDTELGHFFVKYRKPLLLSIVSIVVVLLAYFSISHVIENKEKKLSVAVYNFQQSALADFRAKKIGPADLYGRYQPLSEQAGKNVILFPVMIDVAFELIGAQDVDHAISVFEDGLKKFKKDEMAQYIVSLNLASLYEDKGKYQEAIALLERASQSKMKMLQSKVYLDLGRLYLKSGNKEQARASFQYVVDHFPNDELTRVANLYLADLKV